MEIKMKVEKLTLNGFIKNCFEDCNSTPALIAKIACKLIVFSIMVSVVGYWLTKFGEVLNG